MINGVFVKGGALILLLTIHDQIGHGLLNLNLMEQTMSSRVFYFNSNVKGDYFH